MIRYSFEEIDNIRQKNLTYRLSDETLSIIKNIAHEVGSPTYIKTPSFKKRKHKSERPDLRERPSKPMTTLQEIKCILNKFSGEKTYATLKDQLCNRIDIIRKNEVPDISFKNVFEQIFDAASQYNSDLYTRLCIDIDDPTNPSKNIIAELFNDSLPSFEAIEQRCATTDYEGFCKHNAINDKLRHRSMLYAKLVEKNLLSLDNVSALIQRLQEMLLERAVYDTPNDNPCIEYSENIFILITGCLKQLVLHKSWDNIIENVKKVKSLDRKQYKNISSKIAFKHMDILDMVEKEIP